MLLEQVYQGVPFDRHIWTALVGEILLYTAMNIPEISTAPLTMGHLLAPGQASNRSIQRPEFVAIQQVHWGTHDLCFGSKIYRPEHAGYNSADDVERLARYLAGVDEQAWSADALLGFEDTPDEASREEEVELASEWFPALRELYQSAARLGQAIVCETL